MRDALFDLQRSPASTPLATRASVPVPKVWPGPEVPPHGWGDSDPRLPDFYLGWHHGTGLARAHVPIMMSAAVLETYSVDRDGIPPALVGDWVGDSGGFKRLQLRGDWDKHPDRYGGMWVRFIESTGWPPRWIAIQDWMCEPAIIHGGTFKGQKFVGTGLSVPIHQELTVDSHEWMTREFSFLNWLRVVQGYTVEEYIACAELYRSRGIDLTDGEPVGLGSVCRRESTAEIIAIVRALNEWGIPLKAMHGFGVKRGGLALLARHGLLIGSADSQAGSLWARYHAEAARKTGAPLQMPGCPAVHDGPCNNCPAWVMKWRDDTLREVLTALDAPRQRGLFEDVIL